MLLIVDPSLPGQGEDVGGEGHVIEQLREARYIRLRSSLCLCRSPGPKLDCPKFQVLLGQVSSQCHGRSSRTGLLQQVVYGLPALRVLHGIGNGHAGRAGDAEQHLPLCQGRTSEGTESTNRGRSNLHRWIDDRSRKRLHPGQQIAVPLGRRSTEGGRRKRRRRRRLPLLLLRREGRGQGGGASPEG